jgi:hypothetical protein
MAVMIVIGAGLRLKVSGRLDLPKTKSTRLRPTARYDHGDFTANAEHPMLMKILDRSVLCAGARALNSNRRCGDF